mmetsp:Transcript_1885/g.4445  ORF Transcript_1885/g.4445 Transcript_1885/m.4445 type:complete len:236 (+) Transcript_1885:952-1659(+)
MSTSPQMVWLAEGAQLCRARAGSIQMPLYFFPVSTWACSTSSSQAWKCLTMSSGSELHGFSLTTVGSRRASMTSSLLDSSHSLLSSKMSTSLACRGDSVAAVTKDVLSRTTSPARSKLAKAMAFWTKSGSPAWTSLVTISFRLWTAPPPSSSLSACTTFTGPTESAKLGRKKWGGLAPVSTVAGRALKLQGRHASSATAASAFLCSSISSQRQTHSCSSTAASRIPSPSSLLTSL